MTDVYGAAGPDRRHAGHLGSGAGLLALPIACGVAVFLTEFCPASLRRPIGIAVELLAGIPSIVYGMWGLFVFAPLFANYVQMPLMMAAPPGSMLEKLFDGRAQRHRHPHRLDHPGDHDPALHGRDSCASCSLTVPAAGARERLWHGRAPPLEVVLVGDPALCPRAAPSAR